MPTMLDIDGLEIPSNVQDRGLLPLMQTGRKLDREYIHSKHAECYGLHQVNHYLAGTDHVPVGTIDSRFMRAYIDGALCWETRNLL